MVHENVSDLSCAQNSTGTIIEGSTKRTSEENTEGGTALSTRGRIICFEWSNFLLCNKKIKIKKLKL